MKQKLSIVIVGLLFALYVLVSYAVQTSAQQTACYGGQGGTVQTAASGCTYSFLDGSTFDAASGSTVNLAGDVDFTGATVTGIANSTLEMLTVTDGITLEVNVENIGAQTILTVPITYTAAAGGSGVVATITDGEIWFVEAVFIQVTDDFDATGDDATLIIGDGGDADGFLVAADANLQAAFTEATGYPAGWYGIENGSNGAYTVDEGMFVYAPSGADETIDYVIDETSGETLTAGAATIYVVYTRIQ